LRDARLRYAYAYTIVTVILWTTGPVGSKAALLAVREGDRLTPMQVAFWAIGVGWVALFALMVARKRLGRLREVSARGWLVLAGMGLFGWVGYPVGTNFAYSRLPLPDAMMITNLNPVIVTLLQGALFGRMVRPLSGWEQAPEREAPVHVGQVVGGLVLCLLGVGFIATEGRVSSLGGIRSAEGAAAAVFAAFSWGVYSNLGRFVAMRAGASARGMGDVQNFGAMACGLAAMGAMLWAGGRLRPPLGYETGLYLGGLGPAMVATWMVIVVMGVFNYCLGYPLWLHSLELGHRLGEAYKLPPLTYLLPVTAIACGWLVLREAPGPGFWQGAALIAAGNVVIVWRRKGERDWDCRGSTR